MHLLLVMATFFLRCAPKFVDMVSSFTAAMPGHQKPLGTFCCSQLHPPWLSSKRQHCEVIKQSKRKRKGLQSFGIRLSNNQSWLWTRAKQFSETKWNKTDLLHCVDSQLTGMSLWAESSSLEFIEFGIIVNGFHWNAQACWLTRTTSRWSVESSQWKKHVVNRNWRLKMSLLLIMISSLLFFYRCLYSMFGYSCVAVAFPVNQCLISLLGDCATLALSHIRFEPVFDVMQWLWVHTCSTS